MRKHLEMIIIVVCSKIDNFIDKDMETLDLPEFTRKTLRFIQAQIGGPRRVYFKYDEDLGGYIYIAAGNYPYYHWGFYEDAKAFPDDIIKGGNWLKEDRHIGFNDYWDTHETPEGIVIAYNSKDSEMLTGFVHTHAHPNLIKSKELAKGAYTEITAIKEFTIVNERIDHTYHLSLNGELVQDILESIK